MFVCNFCSRNSCDRCSSPDCQCCGDADQFDSIQYRIERAADDSSYDRFYLND